MKTALTIGFFDGVHLGHQALLQTLKEHPHSTILTFENHPKEFFSPPGPKLLLSTNKRLGILKEYADQVIVFPFNEEFASMSYSELLSQFDISTLILGKGATFGKNREGNEVNIKKYAEESGFRVQYIPKLIKNEKTISSSLIRDLLTNKNIHLAHQLLGRS